MLMKLQGEGLDLSYNAGAVSALIMNSNFTRTSMFGLLIRVLMHS